MSQNEHVSNPKDTKKPDIQKPDHELATQTTSFLLQRAYEAPSTLTPSDVKHLQRTVGNRATVRLLSRAMPIQTKLTLGPVGDQYEREADQVAERVVRQIAGAPVQRVEDEEELQMKPVDAVQRHGDEEELQMKPLTSIQRVEDEEELQMKPLGSVQRVEDEEELQMKPLGSVQRVEDEEELQMKPLTSIQRVEDEEELQMKPLDSIQRHGDEEELQMKPLAAGISRVQRSEISTPPIPHTFTIRRDSAEEEELIQGKYEHGPEGGEVDPSITTQIQAARGSGRPLDEPVRSSMESGFGADFSNVRVHTGGQADTLNRSLNARAFTTGQDVFFRQGEYNPGSSAGQKLLAHELTHTVQQGAAPLQRQESRGIGEAISAHQSTSTETVCRCPACSGTSEELKIQAKSLDTIQRRENNHHNGCNCSSCFQLQRKEAPSLYQRQAVGEHTVDRSREHTQIRPDRMVGPIRNGPAAELVVQRHSSWEHKSLGDANPEDLAKIGAWQDLIEQTEGELLEKNRFLPDKRGPKKTVGTVRVDGVDQPIGKGNVMHVLAQELARLDQWQSNPPLKGSTGEIDSTYQTVLVAIPGGGKDAQTPLVVTYGELNTLADYYGNIEAMKSADRDIRWRIVQSVRKETFLRLRNIYNALESSLTSAEKRFQQDEIGAAKGLMKGNKINKDWTNQFMFEDSIQQDYISGVAGQVNLLKKSGTGAQEKTDNYAATLARNACHFVPESWHAWSNYHQQARAMAEKASDLKDDLDLLKSGLTPLFEDEVEQTEEEKLQQAAEEEKLQNEIDEAANEAILLNGFGDHYLQDSYAAGHMINKTLIMKWFVEYLDNNSSKMDFSRDVNWRKVQAIAYRQPGLATAISGDQNQYNKKEIQGYSSTKTENKAQNPQAVEDNKDQDWMVRFEALGLQVPASLQNPTSDTRKLIEAWQGLAADDSMYKSMFGDELLSIGTRVGLNFGTLKAALNKLMLDGIIHMDYSTKQAGQWLRGEIEINPNLPLEAFEEIEFIIRSDYIPKDKKKFTDAQEEDGDDSYQRMAAMVTYKDYFEFMNNGYLQKSTNALHNKFCLDGLEITSGDGTLSGARVYGDDAMFNKGSGPGVKHSAETAHMSRDAIRNIISTGNDQGITTAKILNRLPDKVEGVDIAVWHNPAQGGALKAEANKIFASEMGVIDKAVGAMGDLTSFLHTDQVHKGEAF